MCIRDSTRTVAIRPGTTRQTPPPAGRRFRDALGSGAVDLAHGALSLVGVQPAGRSVTAVSVGGARAPLSSGVGSERGGPSAGAAGAGGEPSDTLELLEMQRRIGAEQVHYSTVSNVLKARHDTAKSVVGNIR